MERRRLRLKNAALLGGVMLGFGLAPIGASTPAEAQVYVCPPGYYFLANYGCYPFGGYSYYAPPPGYYYPPPGPYYAYPPQYGVTLQFGGRGFDHDHDRDGHDGGHGGFEHHH